MSAAMKTVQEVRRSLPSENEEQLSDIFSLLYRFNVEQYEKMVEIGLLTSEDRVELIEGLLVQKMTQHPPHAVAIDYTMDALRPLLPEGWRLREQKPIKLSDSEPEPDLIIVRGPLRRYETRHPRPADIAVVIEIADTTLEGDRRDKGRMYARARIPIYWIINLNERQIEVYAEPKGGKSPAYRRRTDFLIDAKVPLVIEGSEMGSVSVGDLLPSRAPNSSS
jgi:Uma2 family endonuclease